MLPLYTLNAFSEGPFSGNPAAVLPYRTADGLSAALMQSIAEQNNLAETAYVHLDGRGVDGAYPLRWFTPAQEVRLCGHATLAAAHALDRYAQDLGITPQLTLHFETLSGRLSCSRAGGRWEMDFPADVPQVAPDLHALIDATLPGTSADHVFRGTDDALLVLERAAAVRAYEPDSRLIRSLGTRGLIVTAACDDDAAFDVISRCFYPEFGIEEDSATGSAHTLIGVYWASRLGEAELRCLQASRRRGVLSVRHDGGARVQLGGEVEVYAKGYITW